MKKFFLALIFGLVFSQSICCASMIDNVEKYLYGFTYQEQDETTRLNRIEKTVYGESSNKTNAQKIARLKSDMASDLIGKEIPPVKDTFMEEEERMAEIDEKIAPGSNIDYPVINEMEKTVFNQEFKTNDVNGRLAKLEQKTFGKTYNDDLNSRVDRLRAKIKPSSLNNSIASANDYFDEIPLPQSGQDYRIPSYGDDFGDNFPSLTRKNPSNSYNASATYNLNKIEKALYKQTYQNDPAENRLARVESSIFGTTFDEDSQDVRINRITSAINAQKSTQKYDNNKFSRNMSTAFQIGTILLMVLACIL